MNPAKPLPASRKLLVSAAGVLIAAWLLFSGIYLAGAFTDPPQLPPQPEVRPADSSFILLSDTQSPLWPETFVLDENNNERARSMIFAATLRSRPAAVFHCGDAVALGFDQNDWKPIDRFTGDLSREGIPFFPVPGNHEYLIFPGRGIRNFEARYPFALPEGYSMRIGPLLFLLLNSNFGVMDAAMAARQDEWLRSSIAMADADSLVRGIIVICHHPPFTNSTIVNPSADVQQRFVPPYLQSTKGMLFISGHSHAFEHFRISGKDFLVAGGGGGLQHPLLQGDKRRWSDLFSPPTEKRMFHYLSGSIRPDGVTIAVRMIRDDFSGFRTADSLVFPWRVPPPHR